MPWGTVLKVIAEQSLAIKDSRLDSLQNATVMQLQAVVELVTRERRLLSLPAKHTLARYCKLS